MEVVEELNTSGACQVYLDGNVGIGIKPDKEYDLKMNGNMFLNGYIYFGSKDEYIYSSGGNFHIHGKWFYADTDYIKLGTGNTGVGINGNPPSAGGLIVYGTTYVKSPEDFYLDTSGTTNLPTYIEENAVVDKAKYLVTGSWLGGTTKIDEGSSDTPVYFKNGVPKSCNKMITETRVREIIESYKY